MGGRLAEALDEWAGTRRVTLDNEAAALAQPRVASPPRQEPDPTLEVAATASTRPANLKEEYGLAESGEGEAPVVSPEDQAVEQIDAEGRLTQAEKDSIAAADELAARGKSYAAALRAASLCIME